MINCILAEHKQKIKNNNNMSLLFYIVNVWTNELFFINNLFSTLVLYAAVTVIVVVTKVNEKGECFRLSTFSLII